VVRVALEKEMTYYAKHRDELLQHYKNLYVLIKGEELIGAFTTDAEAYQAGVEQFGDEPFLIKRVTRDEEIEHIPALSLGLLHARS